MGREREPEGDSEFGWGGGGGGRMETVADKTALVEVGWETAQGAEAWAHCAACDRTNTSRS